MVSPWGRTIAWMKVTWTVRGEQILRCGHGGECEKEDVERVADSASVRGGHMGAPPIWEIRPQFVYGAQGRFRATIQSSTLYTFICNCESHQFRPPESQRQRVKERRPWMRGSTALVHMCIVSDSQNHTQIHHEYFHSYLTEEETKDQEV